MKILIVAAHPDDIELSLGGTICELRKLGISTICFHTTNGVYEDIYGNPVRLFDEIQDTTMKSLGILGIPEHSILFDKDRKATELYVNKDSISAIQKIIIQEQITHIFTHMKVDTYHQDHMATHLITMAAARRYINNIFCYESIFNYADGLMLPNSYVEITSSIEKKCDALRLHKTEYDKFGGEQWIDSVKSLANYRGIQVGVKYAEAFNIMKQFKKLPDL